METRNAASMNLPSLGTPRLESAPSEGPGTLRLVGRWTVRESAALEVLLSRAEVPASRAIRIDAASLEAFDTAGALVLARLRDRFVREGRSVEVVGLAPNRSPLLKIASTPIPVAAAPARGAGPLENLTRLSAEWSEQAFGFLSFVGEVFLASLQQLIRPRRIRWAFVISNIQTSGVGAIPIIGLLSFLIGIVIAYQGAVQLHRYGADVFIVDLVGLSMVRELAPLMTAIIVAGRTGSSFTAQIGTMRVTEEVDALKVLGMNPIDVLVLPKLFALVVVLPLLTAFAAAVGVLGGAIMTASMTPIGPSFFLSQFPRVVLPISYFVGVGKAPIFAAVIATVGCYQGFRASGSAESVGAQTTVSVVQSIFLIIVLDALFSIVFSVVGI